MKVIKNIDIYLTNKRPVKTIDVVQGDTGIQLVFTLKDFTIPSGSKATLYVQKPSGKFVYQNFNITVANNTITIDLENQALTEYGDIPYQVSIENGTDTVTTFTGIMIVQRSLKDSGAIKSGTVVRAFDELTVEKLAEFQTRAETAANGVIATIPEDYTEMTAKVNELANAIKGHLSGAVVRADDVSPVEHYPVVEVHGKNLVNANNILRSTYVNVNYTEPQLKITKTNTSEVWANIYIGLGAYGRFVDKTLTLSLENLNDYGWSVLLVAVDSDNKLLYEIVGKSTTGNAMHFTTNIPFVNGAEQLAIRIVSGDNAIATGEEYILQNIQVEYGNTATEYTPYVDPSTVTVTAGGVTYTPNADGTINGISSTVLSGGISTEAEGMTIECEYNKDTNKVIQKLVNAISAMGGEVTI